ncbi:IS110 family transposase [Senegalimassilia anaerobia]
MTEFEKNLVYAGVDTHKDTHTLCLLDYVGRAVGTFRFPADAKGYDALAEKIGGPEACVGVGVEGAGSYGAGLTRRLVELGYCVYEVMAPGRAKRKPGRPKSDPADAEVAARQVLAKVNLSKPKDQTGWTEDLRQLMVARDRLVQATSAMINAAKALIVTGPEDLRKSLTELSRKELRNALAKFDPEADGTILALGSLGRAWDLQDREADALEEKMKEILEANAPALLAIFGCGTVSAAALAVAGGGNSERLNSEAELASLCGAAPLLTSSGKTERHRLNRGGDRRANRALYQIAVTRMSYDQRTKDYVEKRKREGKSKKETIRCLKRYIVREVFRALRHPFEIKGPSWKDLRPARQALGITLVEAGKALNVGFQKVSYAETGRLMNARFLEEYDTWLKAQTKEAS